MTVVFFSIRDSLPDNVAKDFPLKALPEEAYITNTLTEVDAWIIRVKKLQQVIHSFATYCAIVITCSSALLEIIVLTLVVFMRFQGNTIKKGIQLVKVLKIFEESKDIPVNLDTELRVVKAALKAVGGWLQTNRNELSFLNISTGTDVVLSELFKVLDVSNQTDESTDADMDCEVDLEEEKETKDAPHTSKMILYLSDLERIVQSGANLLIDFECLG